jgi:hypothetical protein
LSFFVFGSVHHSKYPMVIGTKTAGLPPKTTCTVSHFVRLVFLRFLCLFFSVGFRRQAASPLGFSFFQL